MKKNAVLEGRDLKVYWNMPSGLTKSGEVDDLFTLVSMKLPYFHL
jgi:hypothetical protein